jgi:hypothetical protein
MGYIIKNETFIKNETLFLLLIIFQVPLININCLLLHGYFYYVIRHVDVKLELYITA